MLRDFPWAGAPRAPIEAESFVVPVRDAATVMLVRPSGPGGATGGPA
jgi:hypothetical protein